MKIFITGASGFIGKYLVDKFISEGHQVTINLRAGKTSLWGDDVHVHTLDCAIIDRDIEYFRQECFDGVIHLASLYLTQHSSDQVVDLIDSNVQFGSYVLECAAVAKISWFINTGTNWQNYDNKEYSPVNLYAATKQAFQSIAQYYIETNKIKFYTIKLFDTYGPNDTRPKIFNLWARIAKTGETLDMSAGEQLIDISYIDDVVSAYLQLIKLIVSDSVLIKNTGEFGVLAKKRYTLRELSKVFEEMLSCKLNINWGGRPYKGREVMIPECKLNVVPGWSPNISLEYGLKNLFNDFSI